MRPFLVLALALAACRGTAERPAATAAPAPVPVLRDVPVVEVKPAKPAEADSPRVLQVKAAIKLYTDATNTWGKGHREAGDEAAQAAYRASVPQPKPDEAIAALQPVLAENETDEAAFQALAWTVRVQPAQANAERLVRNFAADERLADYMASIVRGSKDLVLLERLVKESPHRKVQAMALYELADRGRRNLIRGEASEEEPPLGPRTEAEVLALYERIAAEYGDIPRGKRTFKEYAEGSIREIKYLGVGKVAPDIEGEDIAGVPFKLSDYRGKVVMLDFWGDW